MLNNCRDSRRRYWRFAMFSVRAFVLAKLGKVVAVLAISVISPP